MATNTKELQEQFKIFSQRQIPRMGYPCKVIAINDDDTIDVVDDSDIELFGVRLRAAVDNNTNGIVITPAIDSWVLVAPVDGQREELYVTMYSEIDCVKIAKEKKGITINAAKGTIQMNEGDNGGLIIIQALTEKLNQLVGELNNLKGKYNNHVNVIPKGAVIVEVSGGSGAAAVGTANSDPIKLSIDKNEDEAGDITKFELKDYINTNVTH